VWFVTDAHNDRQGRLQSRGRSGDVSLSFVLRLLLPSLFASTFVALSACGLINKAAIQRTGPRRDVPALRDVDERYFTIVAPEIVRRSSPLANAGIWLRLTTPLGESFPGFVMESTSCRHRTLMFMTIVNNSTRPFRFRLVAFWHYRALSPTIPWREHAPSEVDLRPGQYVDIPLYLALADPPGDLLFAALSAQTGTGVAAVYYCASTPGIAPVGELDTAGFGLVRYGAVVQKADTNGHLAVTVDVRGNAGAYAVLVLEGTVLVSSRVLQTATGVVDATLEAPEPTVASTGVWTLVVDAPEELPVRTPNGGWAIQRAVGVLYSRGG